MMNRFIRLGAGATISLAAMAFAGIANAQTTRSPAVDAAAEADAGEIVVTAQKRAENLQDVPISIAAVGSERLRESKIDSIADLGRVAPGFTTARSTQATNTKLYIRGIGGGGNFAVDPSVAVFVDDAYVARPGAIIGNIFDVSSIEVLRGPQGTLFGRNASAGAVSVHTTAPSDELGGYINAELGAFGAYKLEGAVTLPANEKFAVRFAGLASGFDGYGTTTVNPHRYGRSDTMGGRLSLLLKPTETITWTVRADYLSTTGDGQAELEIDPRSLTPTAIANMTTRLRGNIPDVVNLFDRKSNQIVDGSLTDLQYGITSDFNLELGNYTLRMVNNVRSWDSNQRDLDLLQTPLPILQRTALFNSAAQSHELQLLSPDTLLDGRLKFVAGLYYFRERFKAGEDYDLKPEWCGTIVPLISAALVPSCLTGQQTGASIFRFDQVTNSYAGFAQATFEVLPKLEFTAGGRYTKDERSALYDVSNYNATMAVVRSAEQTFLNYRDDRFTYRLNLSYKPTPELMIFGTYSTGYKAGAFNNATGTPALGQRRLVGPEEVRNYEFGFRSEWFNRSLTLNATAYRVDVKGFQDRGFDGISSVIRNAGDLRQQGFEADINWRATRGLSFSGGVQYLDSKFTDYPTAPGLPGFGGTQNLTGKSPTFAPEWQGNVAVDLKGDIGATGWKYKLHSDVAFQSDANVGLINDNNPQTVQAGYALLGAQASVTLPGDRLTLSIYGQNLTGENYCSQYYNVILDSVLGLRNASTGGTAQRCVVGAPRTYGARIGYTF